MVSEAGPVSLNYVWRLGKPAGLASESSELLCSPLDEAVRFRFRLAYIVSGRHRISLSLAPGSPPVHAAFSATPWGDFAEPPRPGSGGVAPFANKTLALGKVKLGDGYAKTHGGHFSFDLHDVVSDAIIIQCNIIFSRIETAEAVKEPAPLAYPESIASLLFSSELSDFTVKVGTASIPVHRLVLLGRSPVFGRMFSQSGFVEAQSRCLVIEDADEATVRALLRYVYTGEAELSGPRADSLRALADKYQLTQLCRAIDDERIRGLSLETVYSEAVWAVGCGSERVLGACAALVAAEGALPRRGWAELLRACPAAAARLAAAFALISGEEEGPRSKTPRTSEESLESQSE